VLPQGTAASAVALACSLSPTPMPVSCDARSDPNVEPKKAAEHFRRQLNSNPMRPRLSGYGQTACGSAGTRLHTGRLSLPPICAR
jgi:hypothetical protein